LTKSNSPEGSAPLAARFMDYNLSSTKQVIKATLN